MSSLTEEILASEILMANLPTPTREYKFSEKRGWRFDFAWPELMAALEIEGGIWSGGRHVRGKGFISDCEKYNEAALLGWRVLRVPTDWVIDGLAIGLIKRLLRSGLDHQSG